MQDQIIDALRRQQADEAVSVARTWVAQAPGDAQAHRWLAAALRQQGSHDAARESIDHAIALAPEAAELHLEQAGMLLDARQLDDAQAALARSSGLDPNQFLPYIMQAQLALGRGEADEAERLARTAARIAPEHPYVAMVEGMVALQRDDADQALRLLDQAIRQFPDDPQVLYAQGFAYLAKQHWAFAEQAFRRIVEQVPAAHNLRALVAQLVHRQGRPEDALAELAPLAADPLAGPGIHRLVGEYSVQAGRFEDALPHLRQALAATPGDRRVLQPLLMAWQQLGAVDDAHATLETALATAATASDLWLARLAIEAVGSAEARQVAERWAAAMPRHLPALEALMRVHDFAGESDAAEAVARQIVAIEPGRFSGEQRIVEALLERNPSEAVDHVERLLDAAPAQSRPAIRGWLAQVQDRAGFPASAVLTWSAIAAEQAAQRVPLWPVSGPRTAPWPVLAPLPTDPQTAPPLLLWGAPGAMAERIAAVLDGTGRVRADRYGANAPADAFQRYDTLAALDNGQLDPAATVAEWRALLPARGIEDGGIVDWLLYWDNRLLLALRPNLPEGLLLVALRDPRDMLLDWLAWGAPLPLALESPLAGARWLAQVLAQIAELHELDLYPHRLIRLDDIADDPQGVADAIGQALQIPTRAPPSLGPARFPGGHWRNYAQALAEPFAVLAPVAARLGYPET